MSRRSSNLSLILPRCRNCQHYWQPGQGVSVQTGYCKRCAQDRRAAANIRFDLKPLAAADFDGSYLLPRALRRYQLAK